MKVVVLQSNYFPWRGYFDLIRNCDLFIFYDEAKYTKNDWRNRNKLSSDKNTHWITISVPKGSTNLPIDQVKINNNSEWKNKHLSLLEFCYKKSPLYKKQLLPFINHFYLQYKTDYLSELNQYVITTLTREANITTEFKRSSEYELDSGRAERLLSLLRMVGCDKYISGPAARNYLDPYKSLFIENGIEIEYFNYPYYRGYGNKRPSYSQYLSILDFLAYENISYLKEYLGKFGVE